MSVLLNNHCEKSICIRSYSGPHFPAFGQNMGRYGVSIRIQSECAKMWTRITPNTDTFCALNISMILIKTHFFWMPVKMALPAWEIIFSALSRWLFLQKTPSKMSRGGCKYVLLYYYCNACSAKIFSKSWFVIAPFKI